MSVSRVVGSKSRQRVIVMTLDLSLGAVQGFLIICLKGF